MQITRTPGKNVVYLGFALLIAGVFTMFYVPHQRVWASVRAERDGGASVFVAGQRHRHEHEFGAHFAELCAHLGAAFEGVHMMNVPKRLQAPPVDTDAAARKDPMPEH